MEQRWTDLEPDEEDFLKQFGASSMRCPAPELILAAQSGVLPEESGAAVAAHLARCPVCQALARDLADPELSGPTPEEERRIRERVFGEIRTPAQRLWAWAWRPVPVLAALAVVVAIAVWTHAQRQPPPASRAEVAKPAAPQPLAALRLEKPPVKLPMASALVWRGGAGAGGGEYLQDLGAALGPYRGDDFAEAARRLEALARTYPEAAEAHFYLGVCQLFLERNVDAVAALQRAWKLAQGPLALDAAWYSGLAHYRAGQIGPAAAAFRKLCEERGENQAKACAALNALPTPGSAR